MNPSIRVFAATCGSALLLVAGGTRSWEHSSQADFEKATIKKLSLRSDGRLTLAPVFRELYDPSSNYLWAVAQDSQGRLFVGGSGQDNKARVYQVASGAGKQIAEFAELEVHALAIDARDRVYAATSPDGKIYRVRDGAAPEVFYDPKAKYIWALAFDRSGNLFAATGDNGEIHKISPSGSGAVFYKTEESHARSLAVGAQGNLYAGTEPGGLIFRISPAGEGFVVYQASKREITALAIDANGTVYAAAAGGKPAVVAPAGPAPPPPPAPAGPSGPAPRPSAPSAPSMGANLAGGSEVLRIEADGYPRRLWTHPTDTAYALAFDASGKLLVGTGNKGAIHRLEDDLLSTVVLSAAPTQVTGLLTGRQGAVYAVTGNIGKVFQLGPELEKEGYLESETMDAGFFAQWGRINYGGTLAGGLVRVETRSGNLESPRQNWSPWAPVALSSSSGRVTSPPARFAQYRLTLSATTVGAAPGVGSIDLAYLPKNVSPVVEVIDSTPANHRFPTQSLSLSTSQTLTLPALTRTPGRSGASGATASSDSPATSMNYAKGYIGARWLARDDNGDQLVSTVEIRGEKETEWKPLKADVKERNVSWDSTAFPDGEYYLRVTVSDSPSNPPHMALTARLESYPFVIDNTPPLVTGLAAMRTEGRIEVKWRATDALNTISKAEYSLDGGEWKVVEPTTRLSDSEQHDYVLVLENATAGEHGVAVRVVDYFDNVAVDKVVVPRTP